MRRPMGESDGVPALAHSAEKIDRCISLQPGPPYSFGQPGAAQPLAASLPCQGRLKFGSLNALVFRRPASRSSGVRASSMKARTSAWKARSSAVSARSIVLSALPF